jgi:beta-glucosidase
VAEEAEVIVLAIGGNEQTSREAWALKHMGDRTHLELIGRQQELVAAMLATGKPVIVFLFNGSPISIPYLCDNVPVIFECWYLGQETGHAVAEVLFGGVNPGGKLPMTIPRSAAHLPVFYNYKPSARRGYLFDDVSPLYAFGHGLSYTTFKYDQLAVDTSPATAKNDPLITVRVTNTGTHAGDEVAQLYVHQETASVATPIQALKGFSRIHLEPGESRTVQFHLEPADLAVWNADHQWKTEPGKYTFTVGGSSEGGLPGNFTLP